MRKHAVSFSLFLLLLAPFQYAAAGSVSGTVVDAANHATPVHPVWIQLRDPATGEIVEGFSRNNQADGSYLIEDIPPGSYKISYDAYSSASGYHNMLYANTKCDGCSIADNGDVLEVSEGNQTADIFMERYPMVTGMVFDEMGDPIPTINLDVFATEGGWLRRVETEASGVWYARVPGAGEYYARIVPESVPRYQAEIWNDVPCDDCDPSLSGHKITVWDADVPNIYFELALKPEFADKVIFQSGFEKLEISIVSEPSPIAAIESLYNYDVEASLPDGSGLVYSLIDPPVGMGINSETGLVEWAPDTAGDFPVTVRAEFDESTFAEQSWTIRVALSTPSFAMVATGWNLSETTPWSESSAFINETPLMDVDQDGLRDIVYSGPLYDIYNETGWVDEVVPFRWLKNAGDGTFSEGDQSLIPASSALNHERHIEIEDFNQDGLDDLVAVSHGFDVPPFPKERNVVLLSKAGLPLVDSEIGNADFDYPGFSHGLATGDINGDGIKDIVSLDLFSESGNLQDVLRVLVNDGTGSFQRNTSAVQISEETGILDVALIDLDGDGADELLFGSWLEGRENQIFWNDGSGTFSTNYTVLPMLSISGLDQYDTLAFASTDLNFDGLPDLVLSVSRDYQGAYLQFLLNNGDRTFSDATDTYSSGERFAGPAFWIYVHDFNGDTLEDLLVGAPSDVTNTSNINNLWLRAQDGRFEKYALPLNEFNDWGDAWPIDFDGDGDTDLVFRYPRRFNDDYIATPKWRAVENKLIDE